MLYRSSKRYLNAPIRLHGPGKLFYELQALEICPSAIDKLIFHSHKQLATLCPQPHVPPRPLSETLRLQPNVRLGL